MMLLAPLAIAFLLAAPATGFEHPGRVHHRRPPLDPSPPEETVVSYHSDETVPWRTQVIKRKGDSGICIKSHEFAVERRDLTSTCRYEVSYDRDPNRLPSTIQVVTCVNTGCRCSERGDYRCTQLMTPMEVIMFGDSENINPFQHPRRIIKVKSACVCAVTKDNKMRKIKPSYTRR